MDEIEDFLNYADDEDFEDELPEVVEIRVTSYETVLLHKEDMVAMLCIQVTNLGAGIMSLDPRNPAPWVENFRNEEDAKEVFERSLNTSKENGWKIFHRGAPNVG